MISVSDAYKAAVIEQVQDISVRMEIDFSDYNIDNSITSSENYPGVTSDGAQMADGIESPTYKWFDWKGVQFGAHLRSEEQTTQEKGAWSSIRSDENGEYKTWGGSVIGYSCAGVAPASGLRDYPRFRINFSPRTVTSLKAVFDDKLNEWAVDFDVNVYTNDYDTPDHTEVVTGNTSYRWTADISTVQEATAVEIVIKEWSQPEYRAKVIETFTSFQLKFTMADIFKLRIFEESKSNAATTPIGNIPSSTLNAEVLNLDRYFDNDNASSPLAGNVTKNRRVRAYIKMNDTDEIPLGVYYTDSWRIKNNNQGAELSARDVIQLMGEHQYKDSKFITPGIDQNFSYTTTADFDTFIKDNTISDNDKLKFGNASLLCDNATINGNVSGYTVPYNGLGAVSKGSLYCGTADKSISYTYTPGTSITMTFSVNANIPTGANILYYASYKDTDEWNLIENNEYIFTPEDITDTTQTVKLRVFMLTQSVSYNLEVEDIAVTLSEKVTLYALAAKVIQDFDSETNLIQGNYSIDQALGDYELDTAYFAPMSYKAALKKVSEAGGARAYQRRNQTVVIETFKSVGTPVKTFTDSLLYENENPVNPWDMFNRVSVVIYNYIQASVAEEVAKINISIDDGEVFTTTVKFDKLPADTITYAGLPGSVTVTDSTEYTWGVDLEITNASGSDQEFELTINAKPYKATGVKTYQLDNTASTKKFGVIELEIDNVLIQTEAQAIAIAESLINNLSEQRSEIDITVVPDPALELGDTIGVNSDYFLINRSEIDLSAGQLIHKIGGKK